MARVATTTPVPVRTSARRDYDAANANPGQTPIMSITKQMAQMGMDSPQNLISSMILDHERSARTPRTSAGKSSGRLPTQTQGSSSPSEVAKPAPSRPTAGAADERMQSPMAGQRVGSDAPALKHSHWKPVEKAGKCANPHCRRRFTWKDRRSNCCMCGEVFCRACVNFRRKLSSNAEPDPLGTSHHVCGMCFDLSTAQGAQRDRGKEFKGFRSAHLKTLKHQDEVEKQVPLYQREKSRRKRVAVREEADRLTEGYQKRNGLVRNLLSEVRIPDWQKSPNWRPSSQASHCFHCMKQFRMTNRKIHCRICGQVFCSDCTKDEILLYMDGGEPESARWAINGKSGGPAVHPQHFELQPICPHCSKELEDILVEDVTTMPDPEVVSFLDQLVPVQKELLVLQDKVETWLPKYQMIVDSMDIEDNSPQSVGGRHPLRELAKAQCDLSDVFSQLAVKSQSLRGLQAQAKTETQQKLLKHIMIATYHFYSENMYLFRCSRDHLADLVPLDSISEIQSFLDQQSMERVHVLLQQIMFEALNLQRRFGFDDEFVEVYIQPIEAIEEEFRAFLEKKGEGWDEHLRWVQDFVQLEMKSNPKIKIDNSVPRHQTTGAAYVKYRVVQKGSSVAHSCSRELSAKTSDRQFVRSKKSLLQTVSKLDELLSLA